MLSVTCIKGYPPGMLYESHRTFLLRHILRVRYRHARARDPSACSDWRSPQSRMPPTSSNPCHTITIIFYIVSWHVHIIKKAKLGVKSIWNKFRLIRAYKRKVWDHILIYATKSNLNLTVKLLVYQYVLSWVLDKKYFFVDCYNIFKNKKLRDPRKMTA